MYIDREDMLELTRRMTVTRNCFSRIAGAYMDEEGYVDGNFNTHFLKLSNTERAKNLAIAKSIPFSETNVQLKNMPVSAKEKKPGSIWQLLMALRECELKNDAMLYSLYEYIGENYQMGKPYAIIIFYGNYDVPRKGADKASQWESEEVYSFLIGTICPLEGEYEAGNPKAGFLFPAFMNRCTDVDSIDIFEANGKCDEIKKVLF